MKETRCHDCGTFLLRHEEFCPVCHKKNPFRQKKAKYPDSPKNNHYTRRKKGDRHRVDASDCDYSDYDDSDYQCV